PCSDWEEFEIKKIIGSDETELIARQKSKKSLDYSDVNTDYDKNETTGNKAIYTDGETVTVPTWNPKISSGNALCCSDNQATNREIASKPVYESEDNSYSELELVSEKLSSGASSYDKTNKPGFALPARINAYQEELNADVQARSGHMRQSPDLRHGMDVVPEIGFAIFGRHQNKIKPSRRVSRNTFAENDGRQISATKLENQASTNIY
ncbi:unnamed protein product, partial [Allacma fusca]